MIDRQQILRSQVIRKNITLPGNEHLNTKQRRKKVKKKIITKVFDCTVLIEVPL